MDSGSLSSWCSYVTICPQPCIFALKHPQTNQLHYQMMAAERRYDLFCRWRNTWIMKRPICSFHPVS